MEDIVRKVRFIGMQGTDELYRCATNRMVYIRRRYEHPYVEWFTTSIWAGGYEPDTHVRPGISFRLVDRKGNEIFTEKVERISGYWYPYAEKKGSFYLDCIHNLSEKVKGKDSLRTYEEWKSWLMGYAKKSGYNDYDDNWLYYEVEYEEPKKIGEVTALGNRLILLSEKAKHKICKSIWTRYYIRDDDMLSVAELCGFSFKGGYSNEHGR